MLPLVIPEKQIFSFEFWFDGSIRQGMYYRSELFCKLRSYDIEQRAYAYHLGCRLAQKEAFIVLTCTATTCSLWGSLRAPVVKEFLTNPKSSSGSGRVAVHAERVPDGNAEE